jgi:exodeoxyribonuclease VII large subunit
MEHLGSLFSAMDPSRTLRRGYSITMDSKGRAIVDAASIRKGASITTVLAKGRVVSTVKDKEQ